MAINTENVMDIAKVIFELALNQIKSVHSFNRIQAKIAIFET